MAISTGMPLLSLWLTDDSWIEAWIPEERLGELQVGSTVTVSFPAIPSEKFSGELVRIGLATDFEMPVDYLPQTRETRMRPTPQVGVQIQLDDLPSAVRPGMSAIVDIARDSV
jgi:multidrug resistance efflux pump